MNEVRLRVRLRVRWSLRAISAQILVHHPIKTVFFWSRGGGEVRLRGNFQTKPSKSFFSLDERGVGEVRLRVRLRVRRSLRAIFGQRPVQHRSNLVFFGFFLGGVGEVRLLVRLRVRWLFRAMSVQSPVRLRVRLRVRWSLRAISAQILVHHPIKLFFSVDGGFGEVRLRVRLRVRWALQAGSVFARNSCIKPRESSYPAFFFVEGGLGRFDFGFGFGFVRHCEQFPRTTQQTFFLFGGKRGVDEVRLRVRLRVRWSLRAISAQILVHHPIKLFFLVEGGWGGSTSGNFQTKPSKSFFSLDERGVGEVRLRVRLRVRRSLRAIFGQRPVQHRSNLFCLGGLGKFDFGFGFGFGGCSEQCLYKARCILLANRFFLRGGGVGSTSGSASGSWSLRAISAQILVHHPIKLFFSVDGGFGEVRLRVRLRVRWALQAIFVQRPEGVGEVRLRVRLRDRWSLRAISARILVHHPIKLFFCRGGVGRFDFGFGFGFVGHCEQFSYKGRCIIAANRFFGGGEGEVRLRVRTGLVMVDLCSLIGRTCEDDLAPCTDFRFVQHSQHKHPPVRTNITISRHLKTAFIPTSARSFTMLPSGKRLHNYGKIHHFFLWKNSL